MEEGGGRCAPRRALTLPNGKIDITKKQTNISRNSKRDDTIGKTDPSDSGAKVRVGEG